MGQPKVAFAFLTDQYEAEEDAKPSGPYSYSASRRENNSSPVYKKMRTIEIRTTKGKPLVVLQSEDNKVAIETILKQNGWQIASWQDDVLQLNAVPLATGNAVAPGSFAPSVGPGGVQQTVIVNTSQNNNNAETPTMSTASCLTCFGIVTLVFIVFVVIGALSN